MTHSVSHLLEYVLDLINYDIHSDNYAICKMQRLRWKFPR